MFPVAVHADADSDAWGVALGPNDPDVSLLEVVDGDAAVHALTASSKAAPASAPARRWEVLPS
jgi:hypothetical protein